jgi:hypothetical protein
MTEILFQRTTIALDTRRGNAIENRCGRAVPSAGMELECEGWRKKHPLAQHRATNPSSMYNCHGLTFASRRTNITSQATLRTILSEDDYEEVPRSKVSPGDIVIYIGREGEIEHSGMVVAKEDFGARVLSKWGGCHEVVHMIGDCPFDATRAKYYRVTK